MGLQALLHQLPRQDLDCCIGYDIAFWPTRREELYSVDRKNAFSLLLGNI